MAAPPLCSILWPAARARAPLAERGRKRRAPEHNGDVFQETLSQLELGGGEGSLCFDTTRGRTILSGYLGSEKRSPPKKPGFLRFIPASPDSVYNNPVLKSSSCPLLHRGAPRLLRLRAVVTLGHCSAGTQQHRWSLRCSATLPGELGEGGGDLWEGESPKCFPGSFRGTRAASDGSC